MLRHGLILLLVAAIHCSEGGAVRRTVSVVSGRIINGVDAAPGEFPAQLSLQTYGSHNCGASILNANWALTAAHCVVNGGSIELLAGTVTLDSGGSRHPVDQVIVHEGYDASDSWVNDIALMRVSTPFLLDGETVAPIKLPEQGQATPEGTPVTVVGWGHLSFLGPSPNELQKVDIEVWSQELCASLFQDGLGFEIYGTHICAAGVRERGSSCNGDSGGPLLHEGVVVGLVSWSYQCATPPYPTVYTRVASYVDWINQQLTARQGH